MIFVNEKQLHILQHTLGLNEYGEGRKYRNHFVTSKGCSDYDSIQILIENGLMVKRCWLFTEQKCFSVTEKGIDFVENNSPKRPKISKSKARYQRYLEYGDMFDSFRAFLFWDGAPERPWNQ